ncbi:MAG: EndoU domain-containing protein [Akkermansiaceae bacterium]|nr:EndoU domain-containing protein [Akkermansiaceae bacterium]
MTRILIFLLTLLFSFSGKAMGEYSDFGRWSIVTKTTPEFVNLASPQRTAHILTGDATGGGHLFPGGAGKSAFPQSWSADRVMHEISDVATDPLSSFVTGRGGRTVVNGTRDGIDLRVILGSPREGGGIITGFPTNVPRNP